MMVFVDELEMRGAWRYGPSSHLLPYDGSEAALEALHALAARAGLKRSWFQNTRWPHYDCAARLRAAVVAAGAVELPTRAYLRWRKFLAAGEFYEPGSGLLMKLGHWYAISDSGSYYSAEGFADAEQAREHALGLADYDLAGEDVTVAASEAPGGDVMPDANLCNIAKADALLLHWLKEDSLYVAQFQGKDYREGRVL